MRIPKFNVGDIIWFKWEDHYHNYTPGWRTEEDREEAGDYGVPLYCETTGFVLKDDGERVVISCTADTQMSNGGWGVKMKKCIVEYKVLKKAKKEKK